MLYPSVSLNPKVINEISKELSMPANAAFSLKILLIRNPPLAKNLSIGDNQLTTVNNIHEAKKIISDSSDTDSLFDAIICDSEINKECLLHFTAFLSSVKSISQVPFLLLLTNEHINDKLQFHKIQGIDDIIPYNTSEHDLTEKIKILKKYKLFKGRLPYSVLHARKQVLSTQDLIKRIIDIVFSALLLLLMLPLILLIAIAIKLETRGPVIYRSMRAGKDYKIFTFFKFRTMIVNAEDMVTDLRHLNEYKDFKESYFFKIKDDPRVTRVGRFLRRTSLDELPQIMNVLKGDMSLVGNRPLPLYEARSITVDKSVKRFLAPAGITGLWQIKGRSNPNLSVQERIDMDIAYADRHSFLYDMKILLKTPKELIQKHHV